MPPPVFTAVSPATASITKTTQGVTRDNWMEKIHINVHKTEHVCLIRKEIWGFGAAQMNTADTALSEISPGWKVNLHSLIHMCNQKHPWE